MLKIFPFIFVLFYASTVFSSNMIFTSTEKEYLEQKNTLSVAVLLKGEGEPLADKPFVDYAKKIAELMGLKVDFKGFNTVKDLLSSVKQGSSDIAVGFSKTDERKEDFLFSIPFYEESVAIWYRNSRSSYYPIENLSWACVSGSIYCTHLEAQGVDNIYKMDNFFDAIKLVDEGKSDAILTGYITISEYLDSENIINGTTKISEWSPLEKIGVMTSKKK